MENKNLTLVTRTGYLATLNAVKEIEVLSIPVFPNTWTTTAVNTDYYITEGGWKTPSWSEKILFSQEEANQERAKMMEAHIKSSREYNMTSEAKLAEMEKELQQLQGK